ncbi:cytochrome c oxidase assembly protein [Alicyclobacillus tolerans]|uniref:cytochrome c oxidase assembly protein n=1 Tax=Alicyclobacillus tolerans TaxID=90970 RepID=UPI001F33083F|nr:cytochrome c oxidase assembly protein [Alicyclobacillus tolerans]MCF8564714.1 cytochrome c oxidase assembly protein [Alicyclobacillus tolerans]
MHEFEQFNEGMMFLLMQVLLHASFYDLWQPSILAVAVAVQLIYLALTRGPLSNALFHRRRMVTGKETAFFLVGCWLLYFSFGGPLDYISDNYLFSAHMIQHMVEITIMTPLIMKGIPDSFYQFLWNCRWTKHVVRPWTQPVVAGAVFNIVVVIFHVPVVYNLSLQSDSFHFFEHAMFFIVSFFMWAQLLSHISGWRNLTPGQKMVYILYNYNLMMPLVVLLLIANHPWYPHYVAAPRIIPGLTPLADMQLGAILMMAFMAFAYAGYFVKEFFKQNDELVWYS